jgi:uncharacterized membrane protein
LAETGRVSPDEGAEVQARPSSDAPATAAEHRMEKDVDRIAFFSDAIFAIAITLLTLQLSVPKGLSAQELNEALADNWPSYFSFALSFYAIGSYWIAHHRLFRYVVRYDGVSLRLNLLLMAAIAFLPYPTEVVGEYGAVTSAVVLYAASMVIVGVILTLLWRVSRRRGLLDPAVPTATLRSGRRRSLLIALPFLVSIPVAFLDASVAMYLWIAVAAVRPVESLLYRRQSRHAGAG